MDTTRINQNNSGHKYRIAVDIAKEGSHIWDLTPYFKGRVGDNNFGLQVTWYYQGQLMNVVGMKPYIEGLVGQYSFGKNGEIDMDPDAVPVRYDGSPDDCEEAGKATFYFPSQMFPKEGIFKGFIGVKDDRDGSKNPQISGVTIWFKVLPGIAQMGHACDAYVDELDKALQNFKDRLDNHDNDYQSRLQKVIDDARTTYENETKNAHDSLDALKSQIQANRDEQQNLAQHLAGTEQQIAIHDVVTKPEFEKLSSKISDKLAHMDLTPKYYANSQEMEASNPSGTPDLCITADDGHKWLYDYDNNNWMDLGNFNYADIKPDLKQQATTVTSDNLLLNSDFKNLDGWNLSSDSGTCDYELEKNLIGGSNALVINGKDTAGSYAVSPAFAPTSSKRVSISLWLDFKKPVNTDTMATIELFANDSDGNRTLDYTYNIDSTNGLRYLTIPNWVFNTYDVNKLNKMYLSFYLRGNGQLTILRPQVTATKNSLPYSAGDLYKDINHSSDNILDAYPVNKWINTGGTVDYSQSIPIAQLHSDTEGWIEFRSKSLKAYPNNWLNIKLNAKAFSNSAGQAVCYVDFYDNQDNRIAENINRLITSDDFEKRQIVCQAPANAASLKIVLATMRTASLQIEKINAYWSTRNIHAQSTMFFANQLIPNGLVQYDKLSQTNIVIDSRNSRNTDWCQLSTPTLLVKSSAIKVKIKVNQAESNFNPQNGLTTGNYNQVCVREFDANNNKIDETPYILPNVTQKKTIELPYLKFNENSESFMILVDTYGEGLFDIESIEFEANSSLDINNDPLSYHPSAVIFNSGDYGITDKLYEGYPLLNLQSKNQSGNWKEVDSTYFALENFPSNFDLTISSQLEVNNSSSETWLILKTFDKNKNQLPDISFKLKPSNQIIKQTFRIHLDPNVLNGYFIVSINGSATINFGNLSVKAVNEMADRELPIFNIQSSPSSIGLDWAKAPFTYQNKHQKVSGYLEYAVQGASSKAYPKKNLKIKTFKDADLKSKLKWNPKSDWTKNNKFNLKANWIDATQSRNLVNATLVRNATAVTPFSDSKVLEKLGNTQNLGQMEGFPVELYFNGAYYGLMTLNTKKDEKVFGMDGDNAQNEVIEIDMTSAPFRNEIKEIDGNNYATVVHDKPSQELSTNFANFIEFLNSTTDKDFKNKLENYIDIKSAINAYLFGALSQEWDYMTKSILLATYNEGKYFYVLPYDLDSTWNLMWDGSKVSEDPSFNFPDGQYITNKNGNRLFERLYDNFKLEIKKQYLFLRSNVWRNDQIIGAFKSYINVIPEEAYEREQERWPDIPSKKITDFAQIQQSVIERGNAMDKFIDSLVPETDPIQNLQNQINQLKNGTTQK